jgi:hypothetical protein
MLSRRRFVAVVGLAGGALGLPGHKLDALAAGPARELPLGERYGGFALLPEGAAAPWDLQPPRRLPPNFCATGVGRGGQETTGNTRVVKDAQEAASRLGMPIYALLGLTSEAAPSGASVIEYDDGDVYAVSLAYDSVDAVTGEKGPNISIVAFPDFMRPLPLWASNPVEPGGPAVRLEKAAFLPAPGVMVRSSDGFVFHWIADEVYFMMAVENHYPLSEARRLAQALVTVNP